MGVVSSVRQEGGEREGRKMGKPHLQNDGGGYYWRTGACKLLFSVGLKR